MPRRAHDADASNAPYTNRLIHETSPYLLQHAHNPVDWHAWDAAAFEAARREDKPIFLSVGYATCYWCHVMERQVFESANIAEVMNRELVNVKVDREERPDVDDVYMTATQLMTQHGGWPMSVFLTPPGAKGDDDPGLKPFWAGTYIPPEPTHGMPGFAQLVAGVADAWRNRRDEVIDQADRVADAVREHLRHRGTSAPLHGEMVGRAISALLNHYDASHGGIGGAPKFPQPANLQLLLAAWHHDRDDALAHAVAYTLERMARGGIYDQIGGGFHRYATDAYWLVPHFEKMLYDNGQLVELYTRACELELSTPHAALYERIARETCDYVLREMTDDTGAFWSAQDAEVDGYEGGNYLWTRAQVERTIDDPELATLAVQMYGLDQGTNFKDPHQADAEPANVLYLPRPLEELAHDLNVDLPTLLEQRGRINHQLKRARDRRPQPETDDKILVEWNGMMIAGLARAGRRFGVQGYVDAAARAADAIVARMSTEDGGLYRTWRDGEAKVSAFLSDYAFFAHGLIELHRAGAGDGEQYLDRARHCVNAAIERFATSTGGYYDTRADQADLFVRVRNTHDGVIPTGNSQMVHNLLDLHKLTGERDHFERAISDLQSFGELLETRGAAMVHMAHALLRALAVDAQRVESATSGAPRATGADGPVSLRVEPPRVDVSQGEARVAVTLEIAPGHHVNSAAPGVEGLVPTELSLRGDRGLTVEVAYPEGEVRELGFADRPVSVYERAVTIHATLRRAHDAQGGGSPRLTLRYQPCTDRACLPPQVVEVPLEITGA